MVVIAEPRPGGRLRLRQIGLCGIVKSGDQLLKAGSSLGAELGSVRADDPDLARRAGLLHDIGKGVTHEIEGTPEETGAELARKSNESPVVINSIEAHTDGTEIISPIVVLVEAANTISTNRPGAQKETLEGFIKRMEKLESIAVSFSGVQNAYAIQAGRELRVIVDSDLLTDSETDRLVSEISDQVEKEMDFPGQIKISVIREMRAVEYAMREVRPGGGIGLPQAPSENEESPS